MRYLLLLLVLLAAGMFASCGGGSGVTSIIQPPPVHASNGFTLASLSGGYAYGISGASGNTAEGGSGVITADGNGNLTAGEETVNVGGVSCHVTLTGSYTVNANGTGTASVFLTPDTVSAANGCDSGVSNLSLSIANGGAALVLASQDPGSVAVVTAIKQ